MEDRFNEIRIFLGNETVGHNFSYVEFVFDINKVQKLFKSMSTDERVKFSRAKTGEFVFEPKNIIDFYNALRFTKFKGLIGASVYDEAPVLMQELPPTSNGGIKYNPNVSYGTGVKYIKDDKVINAKELIEFISDKYNGDLVDVQQYNDIIEDCEKIINRKAEISSYDLVKCFCARSALAGNRTINIDILKMSLYNLKDDELIREYTDYDISKTIDDVYKSHDVDESFTNLRIFGAIQILEYLKWNFFGRKDQYYVLLKDEKILEILNEEKHNPLLKDILDKVLEEYKSVEEKLNKKDSNKR